MSRSMFSLSPLKWTLQKWPAIYLRADKRRSDCQNLYLKGTSIYSVFSNFYFEAIPETLICLQFRESIEVPSRYQEC
jgi:hypothetical protein